MFLFSKFDALRFFEAQQMFFLKLLLTLSWRRPLSYRNQSMTDFYMITASVMKELKWGKMKKNIESNIFFEVQKYYFVFESRLIFFFQMVIFATLFRHCPTLWKSTLKMKTFFRRCPTLFSSTLKNATLFQRWFDVVRRHDVIST